MKSKAGMQTHSTMLHAPGKSEIQQYNSSDSNEEPIHLNGLKNSSLKRPHEFEGEQQNKKQKKGKSLFSCFSAKWMRNKKRSKKH